MSRRLAADLCAVFGTVTTGTVEERVDGYLGLTAALVRNEPVEPVLNGLQCYSAAGDDRSQTTDKKRSKAILECHRRGERSQAGLAACDLLLNWVAPSKDTSELLEAVAEKLDDQFQADLRADRQKRARKG